MTQSRRNSGLIRMALMGTAFVGLTMVLIVYQPGSPRRADIPVETETSVTRVAPTPLETVGAATSADTPSDRRVTAPVLPTPRIAVTPPVMTTGGDQPASMRDLTFGAISNLKTATTGAAPAPGEPGSLLHSVVQRSIGSAPQTPSTAPIQTTAPSRLDSPRQTAGTYRVQAGDTLVSIARAFYGDVNMASAIFTHNPEVMSRPDNLRAGMMLKLPAP